MPDAGSTVTLLGMALILRSTSNFNAPLERSETIPVDSPAHAPGK